MIDYYNPGDEFADDDGVLIALLEEFNFEMLPDVGFEYDRDDSYYAPNDAESVEAARKADLRRRDAADGDPGSPLDAATALVGAAATAIAPSLITSSDAHGSKLPGPETKSEHAATETCESSNSVQQSCLSPMWFAPY